VVGAVALAAAGITVFGSGRFFQKRFTFVMFFSGSITGLSVGSPVEFRGVRVGQVTKIAAVFDPGKLTITIPVYVEIDPRSLIISGSEDAASVFSTHTLYEPLLEKGLKAQLDIESFITRQLYINMDFYPDRPTRLLGLDPRYPEIPTILSLQEQIVQTLQKLPEKIVNVTDGIERLVNSPAAQESLRDLDGLIRGIATEVGPLMASLTATSNAARQPSRSNSSGAGSPPAKEITSGRVVSANRSRTGELATRDIDYSSRKKGGMRTGASGRAAAAECGRRVAATRLTGVHRRGRTGTDPGRLVG